MLVLEDDVLRVEIALLGAELRSVRTTQDGAEWLWHGDPAWWTGRSPLLFPVVGLSPGGQVTIGGKSYPMGSHGFARHSTFRLIRATQRDATLLLEPNVDTDESFPFAFRLMVEYRLDGGVLDCRATVFNDDDVPMPFQFGFHPALLWPLPGAQGQTHRVDLDNRAQPGMYRPNADGLIDPVPQPSPFVAGSLTVHAKDFRDGAMVFPRDAGAGLTYGCDAAQVRLRMSNLPEFALWQKPGAPYLCLEPWHGTAPFPDQGPALEDRNGRMILAPGTDTQFTMELEFLRPAP